MGERLALPINVRGDLDTANPITDRAAGTLVEATDLHPRYWGPRVGSKAFTRVWESPGTASLYDEITLDGTASYGEASSYEDQFRDLGTEFTIDLWFRLTDAAYAAADPIALYEFVLTSGGYISIGFYGPSHATKALKPFVNIVTTPTRTTADSLVTFDGSTAIVAGSSQQHKYHLRLIRSAGSATLYLNGSSDGSTSSLVATSPIFARPGDLALASFGNSGQVASAVSWKGQIFLAVLRDGVFSTTPIEAVAPCNPRARNVHHYVLGRNVSFGGDDHYFDASRFALHPRINGSGHTISASNDNAFPAPAPVQGIRTWTTQTGRTATVVVAGGVLSHAIIS